MSRELVIQINEVLNRIKEENDKLAQQPSEQSEEVRLKLLEGYKRLEKLRSELSSPLTELIKQLQK